MLIRKVGAGRLGDELRHDFSFLGVDLTDYQGLETALRACCIDSELCAQTPQSGIPQFADLDCLQNVCITRVCKIEESLKVMSDCSATEYLMILGSQTTSHSPKNMRGKLGTLNCL